MKCLLALIDKHGDRRERAGREEPQAPDGEDPRISEDDSIRDETDHAPRARAMRPACQG